MMPDDELATAFARDGVACLRSVLGPGEVAEAEWTYRTGTRDQRPLLGRAAARLAWPP